MIQRIQSVFLFLSMVLFGIGYFAPVFHIIGDDLTTFLSIYPGKVVPSDGFSMSNLRMIQFVFSLLIIGAAIFALGVLLVYRKLKRQVQLAKWLFWFQLVSVCFIASLSAFYVVPQMNASGDTVSIGFSIPLQLCATILTFLAFKAIKKDYKLIRSVDRLR